MQKNEPLNNQINNINQAYKNWEKLGSPKYVCAPMVGQSELPFRLLVKKYGCQLGFTPMIKCDTLLKGLKQIKKPSKKQKFIDKFFQTCPEERPIIAQLAGNNGEEILETALLIQEKIDGIDLNFGCPQQVARKHGYGAYLLEFPEIIEKILLKLQKAAQNNQLIVPYSCKMRILNNEKKTLQLAKMMENLGATFLTVHGRTIEEKHGLQKENNLEIIKQIKQSSKIPIIANGGIYTYEDVQQCLKITQCDAVMSAEGLLENPALFQENKQKNEPVNLHQIALEYLDICEIFPPTILDNIRVHLQKFFFQTLKNNLELNKLLYKVENIQQFKQVVKQIIENSPYKEEPIKERGWYFRHRQQQKI
ncbi:hypothetical protein PPERSA_07038 [Pseudocohnilembus persalinus]|uniref:tRNA-dihydrouridine synthase n=1 Tax=Pseudocohnilembus persalinus TaxID=266149 RepID=A0A0V0QM12_PSEPJ|nr:hypothetical protein PPERSA_07038 [Pseudocohnilembus persalinus]|eukprot:KRX03210.1 hypothetical protein PPERSA_07038 [Pseudocohnilembus persalinus]